jgi:hypothetical protein
LLSKNIKTTIKIGTTIILPVVCQGGGVNIGSKRDAISRGWRKLLCSEELHDLYFSPNIIRAMKRKAMRCAGRVSQVREKYGYFNGTGHKTTVSWKELDGRGLFQSSVPTSILKY